VYVAVLATLLGISPSNGGLTTVVTHSTFVPLSMLVSYLLRDTWSLLTLTLKTLDAAEDTVLWLKITLLLFTALCAPLLQPFEYRTVDPDVRILSNLILRKLSTSLSLLRVIWIQSRRLPSLRGFCSDS
jgi:hypothetical protein